MMRRREKHCREHNSKDLWMRSKTHTPVFNILGKRNRVYWTWDACCLHQPSAESINITHIPPSLASPPRSGDTSKKHIQVQCTGQINRIKRFISYRLHLKQGWLVCLNPNYMQHLVAVMCFSCVLSMWCGMSKCRTHTRQKKMLHLTTTAKWIAPFCKITNFLESIVRKKANMSCTTCINTVSLAFIHGRMPLCSPQLMLICSSATVFR